MNNLTLKSALSVLSKSSPFSVKTDAQREPDDFDRLKDRLFVRLEIEAEFRLRLHESTPGDIIFLTGSSGDGKSEILTRAYKEYGARYRFHLDATHSFAPRESAIDALDRLLDETEGAGVTLVVGINVGMLANYGKEGAERHADVKKAIEYFLKERKNTSRFQFLDFEDYPKFSFQNDTANSYSDFAQALMRRLTESCESNPYYAIAKAQESIGFIDNALANFNLLSRAEVQSKIVETLFRARLERDQFITTRALLDFLHFLLVGDRLLVDSLFSSTGNELASRTSEYDPAQQHNAQIDGFILRYELGLRDSELDNFIEQLRSKMLLPKEDRRPSAFTLLRLFYILQGADVGNNYHRRLSHCFGVDIVREYEKIWLMHKDYSDSTACKQEIKSFYNNTLISSIYTYVNRNASRLGRDEFYLGMFGRIQLAAKIRMRPDYQSLLENRSASSTKFCIHIKVGEKSLGPINMPLSLFELIYKINCGYRPNKYDKSTVILLEELIEKVADEAKKSTELRLCEAGTSYRVTLDDDMLEISEES